MRLLLLVALLSVSTSPAKGQRAELGGRVLEAGFEAGLRGAHVLATSLADTARTVGVATNRSGFFSLKLDWEGPTAVQISHVGFRAFGDSLDAHGNVDFGVVRLQPDVTELETVNVEARRERMTIRGDTVEFFAGGFFVPRYTQAEALVNALPGFSIDNGVVFYLGKPVDRVLVDGKAYFGSDVMEALQTLPVEMIEALQVYEELPENRQFSGVDDGTREQVINLVTDPQKRNALTADVSLSGGTSDRYSMQANVAHLNAPRNVRASFQRSNNTPGSGGFSKADSGTLSYANTWRENTRVRMTYTLRDSQNETLSELSRTYLAQAGLPASYTESRTSEADSEAHTFSGSVRHTIAGKHQLSFSPRLLVMRTSARSSLDATTAAQLTGDLSRVLTGFDGTSTSLAGGFDADWEVTGDRTGFRSSLGLSASDDAGNDLQTSSFDPTSSFLTATESASSSQSISLDGSIGFMKRLGEDGFLSVDLSHTTSEDDQDRLSFTTAGDQASVLDSTLSSRDTRRLAGTDANLNLYYEKEDRGMGLTLGAARNRRTQDETLPEKSGVAETDYLLSAGLELHRSLGDLGRLAGGYHVSGSSPSGGDLSRRVDYSNPLFLRVGNPDLVASATHVINTRVTVRQRESNRSVGFDASLTLEQNQAGSETWYAGGGDRLVEDILVPAGGQLSRTANLGSANSFRLSADAATALPERKGELRFRFNLSTQQRPVSINGERSSTRVRGLSGQLSGGIRPSQSLSLNATYSLSHSSSRYDNSAAVASDYITHQGSLQGALQWESGLSLNSIFGFNIYERLGSDFDTASSSWNVQADFRPKWAEQLSASLSLIDILDSADTVSGSSSALYLERARQNQLGRHVLFSIHWNIRSFRPGRGVASRP
ncbi:MAG: hypothetical protein ACI84D_000574 [Thalassolituus oleivorans]